MYVLSLCTLARRVALPNSFDGAVSIGLVHSKPHGQTSLPVPPKRVPDKLNTCFGLDDAIHPERARIRV